ncbi:MAG: LacI family transcriptional regulator [Clostridia bacterium]|nr:LacI family transcriptional regulator [Clostridia bacterium]
MITRKDVADLACVSKTTVTRVLSGKGYVSEESRKRVQDAVAQLNYIPNNIAKNLNRTLSNIIAVLVEDLTNQYYMQIIDSMNQEAMKHGLMVSVFSINRNNINSVIESLISNRVCGIVNLALYTCDYKYIKLLKDLDVFLINLEGGNSLVLNYEPGIVEVFKRLKETGKTRVAFFAGVNREMAEADSRYMIYRKCVKEFGFIDDEDFVVFGDYPEEDAFSVGRRSVRAFYEKKDKVDAILCLNDVVAVGVMRELWGMGIKIPEQVSVIGCDNIITSAYMTPPLASLDIDKETQGKVFVENTINRAKQKKYVFNAQLIKRESLI